MGWLTFAGTIIGVWRYDDLAPPAWVETIYPFMLAGLGGFTAWFLGNLLWTWLWLLFPRS